MDTQGEISVRGRQLYEMSAPCLIFWGAWFTRGNLNHEQGSSDGEYRPEALVGWGLGASHEWYTLGLDGVLQAVGPSLFFTSGIRHTVLTLIAAPTVLI